MTSLREELQDYAVLYIQALEDDDYDGATKQTDRILALLLKKLPEKIDDEIDDGFLKDGYNQALADVRSILGEK